MTIRMHEWVSRLTHFCAASAGAKAAGSMWACIRVEHWGGADSSAIAIDARVEASKVIEPSAVLGRCI
jgi:hypothetical protein